MTSSNNFNIDLRPGTRLVRENRGGREVMWVENDGIMGMGAGMRSWFMGMMMVMALVMMGVAMYNTGKNNMGKMQQDMPAVMEKPGQ